MRRFAAWVALVLTLAACTSSTNGSGSTISRPSGPSQSQSTTTPSASPSSPPTTAPTLSTAARLLAGMSEAERVGQLFMVDCPTTGVTAATIDAVTRQHVGSIILDGTSQLSVAEIGGITAKLQQVNDASAAKLFIATDQEGGEVQRLQGPGFSAIPSAVEQGTIAPTTLWADARQWGAELRAAGVNVNLGPVLDTVPPHSGGNPPIGDLDREYGTNPTAVSSHGVAVARGLDSAGVSATAKHFPGLGRVTGNPDLASGVLDTVTTRHDLYLAPFATAIRNDVAFVMMSTAIYTRIDPDRPAAFSPTIVTRMLRGDLGFRGVIISDDLGIAKQVSGYSTGERAVAFISAGGDMVLTVDATQTAQMAAAVLARAKTDPAFRAQVDRAALLVLLAKQARGLLK